MVKRNDFPCVTNGKSTLCKPINENGKNHLVRACVFFIYLIRHKLYGSIIDLLFAFISSLLMQIICNFYQEFYQIFIFLLYDFTIGIHLIKMLRVLIDSMKREKQSRLLEIQFIGFLL